MDLVGIAASYAYVFTVIFLARFLRRFGTEAGRKFIHIMVCNWWFLGMFLFESRWLAAAVPGSFVVINYLSYRYDLIGSMERPGGGGGAGTVYYAVSLTVLAFLTLGHGVRIGAVGGAGILALGYGDGFAAIAGTRIRSGSVRIFGAVKSISGSSAMFCFSFAAVLCMALIGGFQRPVLTTVSAAAAATAAEALTPAGFDNLTVPLAAALVAALLA